MNNIILIGRIANDLELKEVGEGKVVNFSIAVNKGVKNAEGNYEADFFQVVVWNNTAENLVKFCKKGDQIAVSGRLQNRSYDTDNGFKRYVTEIVANNIQFLQSKKGE